MKRDILPTFCQIFSYAHALDGLFVSRVSVSSLIKSSLPIKDHKFLLFIVVFRFIFYFPVKSTGCPHLECDISHLAYMEQGGGRTDGRTVTS